MEEENEFNDSLPDTSRILEASKEPEESKRNGPTPAPLKSVFGITVEPVLFLALFGSNMSSILLTNLLLIRSCEYMDLQNCTTIDTHPGGPSEKIVQPYVTNLVMYKTIFESLVPTITAFFIGPWSDLYGRRPLMIFPLLGYSLNFALLICFAWFNIPPMFVLVTSAPLVFLGGSMTFFTGVFCYVNDICPKKDLAFRLALTEGALFLGFVCGNIAGPYMYTKFPSHGFEGVFSIGLALCLSALLYTVFLVPETIVNNEHSVRERLKALVDYRQVVDLFRVCFGNHEGHSKSVRLICVGATLLSLIALEGTISIAFLFSRNKFSWDAEDYSLYADASFLMSIFGTIFGTVVLTKWLNLPNAPVSCFAFFLKTVSYVMAGFANSGWWLYLSSAVGGLGGMSSPLTRAIMSDTVPKNDIGKLFSIISAFMSAGPMVAGLTYALLYNRTLETFPGAVFLLSAALSAACCLLLGAVVVLNQFHNKQPYRLTSEEQEDEPQPA